MLSGQQTFVSDSLSWLPHFFWDRINWTSNTVASVQKSLIIWKGNPHFSGMLGFAHLSSQLKSLERNAKRDIQYDSEFSTSLDSSFFFLLVLERNLFQLFEVRPLLPHSQTRLSLAKLCSSSGLSLSSTELNLLYCLKETAGSYRSWVKFSIDCLLGILG